MLSGMKKRPKQLVRSHLKIALTSFDELMEAYQQLESNYRDLQAEYEKIVKWLQQGMRYTAKELLEKDNK